MKAEFIYGKSQDIRKKYNEFLSNDVEIISTTLSQDFTGFNHTERFVLVVTYKDKSPDRTRRLTQGEWIAICTCAFLYFIGAYFIRHI